MPQSRIICRFYCSWDYYLYPNYICSRYYNYFSISFTFFHDALKMLCMLDGVWCENWIRIVSKDKSHMEGENLTNKIKIIDRKRHLFVQNWIILNNSSLLGVKIKNLLQFFVESDFRNIKTTDRDEKSFVFLVKKFLCQLIGFQ